MPYADTSFVHPLVRAAGALSAAGALILASTSMAFAQTAAADCPGYPVLRLENPAPGSAIPRSSLILKGVAYDPAATSGTGIASVTVFFDDRDRGGLFRGAATLGLRNPFMPSGQFSTAGFERSVSFAVNAGPRLMYVYARSSVTGRERWVTVPVRVGGSGTAPLVQVQPCSPAPAAGAPAAAAAAAPAPAAATAATATAGPILRVTGPTSGTLPKARVVISGYAYDPAARTGTGVDMVTVFAGDRNTGGRFLGSATLGQPNPTAASGQFSTAGWSVSANFTRESGGRDVYVYARSSVTGRETVTTFRVTVS